MDHVVHDFHRLLVKWCHSSVQYPPCLFPCLLIFLPPSVKVIIGEWPPQGYSHFYGKEIRWNRIWEKRKMKGYWQNFWCVLVLGGRLPGWNERYLPTHKAPIGPDSSLPRPPQISVLWICIVQEGFGYELIAFKDKGKTCLRRWQPPKMALAFCSREFHFQWRVWVPLALPTPWRKMCAFEPEIAEGCNCYPWWGALRAKLSMDSVQSVPHRDSTEERPEPLRELSCEYLCVTFCHSQKYPNHKTGRVDDSTLVSLFPRTAIPSLHKQEFILTSLQRLEFQHLDVGRSTYFLKTAEDNLSNVFLLPSGASWQSLKFLVLYTSPLQSLPSSSHHTALSLCASVPVSLVFI